MSRYPTLIIYMTIYKKVKYILTKEVNIFLVAIRKICLIVIVATMAFCARERLPRSKSFIPTAWRKSHVFPVSNQKVSRPTALFLITIFRCSPIRQGVEKQPFFHDREVSPNFLTASVARRKSPGARKSVVSVRENFKGGQEKALLYNRRIKANQTDFRRMLYCVFNT